MQRFETVISVAWLLLGSAVCVYSIQLGLTSPFGPGSGFFPLLAGLVIAGAALGLLFAPSSRIPSGTVFWPDFGGGRRAVILLAILVVMLALMPYAGFLLAALLTTPLMLRAVGDCSWRFAAGVGVSASVGVHALFAVLLGTPLPRGPFGF